MSDTLITYPCGRARLDVEKLFAKPATQAAIEALKKLVEPKR